MFEKVGYREFNVIMRDSQNCVIQKRRPEFRTFEVPRLELNELLLLLPPYMAIQFSGSDCRLRHSTAKLTLLTILSFDSIVTTSIPTKAAVKRPWMLAETHHFAAEFEDFLERSKNINLFS